MDAKDLAKILLDNQDYQELIDALNLLENKKYEEFYKCYANILCDCMLFYSYDDFIDYLSEDVLDESIFVFGFLWLNKKCIIIGGYEERIQRKINLFIESKVDNIDLTSFSTIDIFTDYDGDDNFMDYISQLNQFIFPLNMKIVVFFDDIYYACAFHILVLNAEIAEIILNSWNDDSIHIE